LVAGARKFLQAGPAHGGDSPPRRWGALRSPTPRSTTSQSARLSPHAGRALSLLIPGVGLSRGTPAVIAVPFRHSAGRYRKGLGSHARLPGGKLRSRWGPGYGAAGEPPTGRYSACRNTRPPPSRHGARPRGIADISWSLPRMAVTAWAVACLDKSIPLPGSARIPEKRRGGRVHRLIIAWVLDVLAPAAAFALAVDGDRLARRGRVRAGDESPLVSHTPVVLCHARFRSVGGPRKSPVLPSETNVSRA
jgi:hypothetical protein